MTTRDFTLDDAPAKRRGPPPERAYLQPAVVVWIGRNLRTPHKLIAHDRGEAKSKMQHLWEKQRGMVAGTPDLQLIVAGGSLWCELKWGKGQPSEPQKDFATDIERFTGHWWFCAWSVVEVCDEFLSRGLDIHPLGRENALAADRAVALRVAEPPKPPRANKPQRFPMSKRVVARARAKGIFV